MSVIINPLLVGGGPDLSEDTIVAGALLEGYTAHDASGEPIVGTLKMNSNIFMLEVEGQIPQDGTASCNMSHLLKVEQYAQDLSGNILGALLEIYSSNGNSIIHNLAIIRETSYDNKSGYIYYKAQCLTSSGGMDTVAKGASLYCPNYTTTMLYWQVDSSASLVVGNPYKLRIFYKL